MNINATLFAQMIVFAILIWVTMKFIWPPLMKAMDERSQRIGEGLAAADRSQRDLAQAQEQVNEVIREARGKATEIIDQAHARANQIIDAAKGRLPETGNLPNLEGSRSNAFRHKRSIPPIYGLAKPCAASARGSQTQSRARRASGSPRLRT